METVKTIPAGLLEKVVERLKAEFQPEQIFLFGSHAWGTPHEDIHLRFRAESPSGRGAALKNGHQETRNPMGRRTRLQMLELANIFLSMKRLSKRELVCNPSLASHLKPSLQLEDGREPLALSRRKRVRLTAGQIHAELDRLCKDAPAQDAQAALRDLRQ